eukprot:7643303-Pyramimonas_sp.AAC.1
MRPCVSTAAKRAAVVKEADLLATAEIQANPTNISNNATNIMTSKYVNKWKCVKNDGGEMERTMRQRLILRGFMDVEALDVETVTGTARRASQRSLASAAARQKQWVMASMDIGAAFLKGLTGGPLAKATCAK